MTRYLVNKEALKMVNDDQKAARSARGRSSKQRGKSYELQFAKFLQVNGYPDARRAVVTGFRTSNSVQDDPGDIAGTPLVVWDVKQRLARLTSTQATAMLLAIDLMRKGQRANYGFLIERVERRPVSEWRAWLWAQDLTNLVGGDQYPVPPVSWSKHVLPCSLAVADLITLLDHAGLLAALPAAASNASRNPFL